MILKVRCKTVTLIENKNIGPRIHALRILFDGKVNPGQFFMLRAANSSVLLPRAISVCDYAEGTLTLLIQDVGSGTGILSFLRPGDHLTATGPLGNGFPLCELSGKIALVGGGIGVAPLLYVARVLAESSIPAEACLGFRDMTFLTTEFEKFCGRVFIATENGSNGHRGYVTGVLNPENYSAVLCCGPEPMMRAVAQMCAESGTPVYLSLENKMACGVGGCFVCTCTDKSGHNRRTCLEGPVFRGEEVNFDA